MNMNTLELTDDQLWIVQRSLDFYSRVGIGQFWVIKEHPTFEKHLSEEFALKKGPLSVGDRTVRGEVVEIDPDGEWVKTKGSWGQGEEIREWSDVENVKHSTDYNRYHDVRETVDRMLIQPRNMLINDSLMPQHGSWGIHNPSADDSCRIAFDILQVIRHERWKADPNRSNAVVSSHVHFTHSKDNTSNMIKCNLKQ
jgi:hypothetical protein